MRSQNLADLLEYFLHIGLPFRVNGDSATKESVISFAPAFAPNHTLVNFVFVDGAFKTVTIEVEEPNVQPLKIYEQYKQPEVNAANYDDSLPKFG